MGVPSSVRIFVITLSFILIVIHDFSTFPWTIFTYLFLLKGYFCTRSFYLFIDLTKPNVIQFFLCYWNPLRQWADNCFFSHINRTVKNVQSCTERPFLSLLKSWNFYKSFGIYTFIWYELYVQQSSFMLPYHLFKRSSNIIFIYGLVQASDKIWSKQLLLFRCTRVL